MKGILFTEPLFHKVVNGTKTQTRRIVKPQPQKQDCKTCDFPSGHRISWKCPDEYCKSDTEVLGKPRYKPGETLYLKEPYRIIYPGANTFEIELKYTYKKFLYDYYAFADTAQIKTWVVKRLGEQKKSAWCNKLFMPEFIARHYIKITGVRCERLKDISASDCIKEGVEEQRWEGATTSPYFYVLPDMSCEIYDTPREGYAALIDKISGKGTWESNPYVWVYDFKIIK